MALANIYPSTRPQLFTWLATAPALPAATDLSVDFIMQGAVLLTYNVGPPITIAAEYIYINSTVGWQLASIPGMIAGEAHIGEVGGWSDLIVVTPAIAAAVFSAKDVVGGKLTLAGAVRVAAGKGVLDSLVLVDASKQNAPLLVFIFGTDLAGTYADNAAEAVTAADWLKRQGMILINDTEYQEMANGSQVDKSNLGIKVKAASGTSLYALIVTTGTPTYGANALQLTFGMGD